MNQPLPSYPDYKPAGLPWLAEVPAHWEMPSNSRLFRIKKETVGSTHNEYTLLSLTLKGVIPRDLENAKGKFPAEFDTYQRVQAGNFIFCLFDIDETPRTVGLALQPGMITGAYTVLDSLQPDATQYLYYYYLHLDSLKLLRPLYTGLRKVIKKNAFLSLKTPFPPLPEQQRIVSFLDGKTRQIARLLRNKRQLIKLLTEQKQALIHRAVTQGLDADAPRKDSGVAWLGEVPTHWAVVSIGRIAKVGNGSTPSRATPEYWLGGEYPWLNSSNANRDLIDSADQFVTPKALAECHLPRVPIGSILVAITGQGKTRGKAALLGFEATINQHIAYITPNQKITPAYLQLILTAAYATLRSISDDSGSTKGALTCADLKRFKVAFPAVTEQSQVLSFLAEETNLIDQTISRAQREIELIQEYRTRLIADVVTGRVDVRHLANEGSETALPEELEAEEEDTEEEILIETEDGRD